MNVVRPGFASRKTRLLRNVMQQKNKPIFKSVGPCTSFEDNLFTDFTGYNTSVSKSSLSTAQGAQEVTSDDHGVVISSANRNASSSDTHFTRPNLFKSQTYKNIEKNTIQVTVNGNLPKFLTPSHKHNKSKEIIGARNRSSSSAVRNSTSSVQNISLEIEVTSLVQLPNGFPARGLSSTRRPPPGFEQVSRSSRSASSSGAQALTTPSNSKTRTSWTPKSSSTTDTSHQTILAITEGRGKARGEVGIAAIDLRRPHLMLYQISDSQTYINTLAKINVLNPVEMLVPNTFVDGLQPVELFTCITEKFPSMKMTTVQRQHFNNTAGLKHVQSLCLPEYATVELIITHKFYALSAVSALLKYIEFTKNVIFSPRSLKIEYSSASNIMTIDVETAQRLELVLSRIPNKNICGSLLGVLNYCTTVSGLRFLRTNILQPSLDLSVINTRLSCVTELISNPNLLYSLQSVLLKFYDVEQLLWLCLQVTNFKSNQKASIVQTNYVLLLKNALESLPPLRNYLTTMHTAFFSEILKGLEDDRYKMMLDCICEIINEDTYLSKSHALSEFQRCFAVKADINELLDVARAAYTELIDKIQENVINLAEEYDLPLKLHYTGARGIHVQINITHNKNFTIQDLPSVFIQSVKRRTVISCTTEELITMNERLKQAKLEILMMSNAIIFEMLQRIRPHIGCLYKLCEKIAELDLLVTFAHISSSANYAIPTFGDHLNLKASRHPILEFSSPVNPVPNDVFASSDKNFHIITGPNMCGKSIYIKQIPLLQIMAQIGCYVPAESAQFKIIDQLFSRSGFEDSIEHNASSFVLEMQEVNLIFRSLTPRTLIIVDELCRSTSCEEGTAIAWVLCEHMIQSEAIFFFTTHFLFLTKLETLYSNVINHHLLTDEKISSTDTINDLVYTYKLCPGVMEVTHYGLRLLRTVCFPQEVYTHSKQLAIELHGQHKASELLRATQMEMSDNDERIDEFIDCVLHLQDEGILLLEIVKYIQSCFKKWKNGESFDFLYNIQPLQMQEHCENQVHSCHYNKSEGNCENQVYAGHNNKSEVNNICSDLQSHSNDQQVQTQFDVSQNVTDINASQTDDNQDYSQFIVYQHNSGYGIQFNNGDNDNVDDDDASMDVCGDI